MAGAKRSNADATLKDLAARPKPKAVIGAVRARASSRPRISPEERTRLFDEIRASTKENDDDSTDLIRRDRDESREHHS